MLPHAAERSTQSSAPNLRISCACRECCSASLTPPPPAGLTNSLELPRGVAAALPLPALLGVPKMAV